MRQRYNPEMGELLKSAQALDSPPRRDKLDSTRNPRRKGLPRYTKFLSKRRKNTANVNLRRHPITPAATNTRIVPARHPPHVACFHESEETKSPRPQLRTSAENHGTGGKGSNAALQRQE